MPVMSESPPLRGRGLKFRHHDGKGQFVMSPPLRGRGLKSWRDQAPRTLLRESPPSRGAWIEIAAHTAPCRSRPSPLHPVCPPGAPSCRPEKSSFVPSVVMYPVSFQLFVSPKNSFADFTWPFFSASTGAFSENCGLIFSPSVSIPVSEGLGEVTSECVSAEKEVLLVTFFFSTSRRSYKYDFPSASLRIKSVPP